MVRKGLNMQWTEQYRPENLSGVFGQEKIVSFFKEIGKRDVSTWPHFIFYGPPGVGKTTMAYAIASQYDLDIIEMNASHYRHVDDMENEIFSVVKQIPEKGTRKILFLDEADGLTPTAQWSLRRKMEEYSNATLFILACNYDAKIIPAVYDRCLEFYFNGLDLDAFKLITKNIYKKEGKDKIPPDSDVEKLMTASGGSARSYTNLLYQYDVMGGQFIPESSFDIKAYIKAIKMNDIESAKKLVLKPSFHDLLKEVIDFFLDEKYRDKYGELILKLGDYFLLSPNPDDNLGKIVLTMQLRKYLNGGTQ